MMTMGKRIRATLDDHHDSNLAQFIAETATPVLTPVRRPSSMNVSGSNSAVSVHSTEVTSDFQDSTGDGQYMGLQKRRLVDQLESLTLGSEKKANPLIQVIQSEDYATVKSSESICSDTELSLDESISDPRSLKIAFADKGLEKRMRSVTRWDILGEPQRARSWSGPKSNNREIELQSRLVDGKQQSLLTFFKYYLRQVMD